MHLSMSGNDTWSRNDGRLLNCKKVERKQTHLE